MAMIQAPVRYFLGVNTPAGFRHTAEKLYDPADGWRVYLLKGGAGSGKSTLLKRLYAACEEADVFCCSSDPSSVDGVRIPSKKVLVLDATAPHAVEPQIWGACETVIPLCRCTDDRRLYERRDEMGALTDECRRYHLQARRCLGGAAQALDSAARLQRAALNEEHIGRTAARIAEQEWGASGGNGTEERRWLSAVTPLGVLSFFATVQALCPRIYAVCDEYGGAASLFMREIRRLALAAGQRVIVSFCPLFPDSRIEHLLLPEQGTAFITANRHHPVDFPLYRRIHAERFADSEMLGEHRNKLRFDSRAADELIDGAVQAAVKAQECHSRLEHLYYDAMDWEQVQHMGDEVINKIVG